MDKPNPVLHRYTPEKARKKVAAWMINYTDIFDMKMLYLLCHEWLVEEGWVDRSDPDFPEIYFLKRELPFGLEYWIRWRCKKTPEGVPKIKDKSGAPCPLFQYSLDIEFHIFGMTTTEIVVGGKKLKANKGEVEIRGNAGLIVDEKNALGQTGLFEHFAGLWKTRMLKQKLDEYGKELYHDAYRFREAVSTYLQIEKIRSDVEFSEFWAKRMPEE